MVILAYINHISCPLNNVEMLVFLNIFIHVSRLNVSCRYLNTVSEIVLVYLRLYHYCKTGILSMVNYHERSNVTKCYINIHRALSYFSKNRVCDIILA